MIIETLITLMTRDLHKLKGEINAYQNQDKIWIIDQGIANSAGNLCLHLIGNLNTYVGAVLGNTGYIRQRDLEFSLKDIEKTQLMKRIDETIHVVGYSLSQVDEKKLEQEYPLLVFDQKTSTEYMLIHLATHLTYHLGQVNYHRRLLDK
ncbi:MAG: DUF1572 family protein [Saprospiraceae bacterium]|nr:DUF1572 family protein [Saprospiraceae bacterium]